jgi:hypothetical protein
MPANTKTAAHDGASVILGRSPTHHHPRNHPHAHRLRQSHQPAGTKGTLIENALVCETEESLIIVHAFDHATNTLDRGQDMQAVFTSGCETTDRPEHRRRQPTRYPQQRGQGLDHRRPDPVSAAPKPSPQPVGWSGVRQIGSLKA